MLNNKPEYKYIYKTIILHEQDLKFHTKVIKRREREKEGKYRYTQQGLRYYQKAS